MKSEAAQQTDPNAAAFEFVRELAKDLTRRTVELPSFSEVAMRVQKALGEDNCSSEQIVRILGAEPLLAARVLTMANSAALNVRGAQIKDLRTAVVRVGFDTLRAAAISFAMEQLQRAKNYAGIAQQLNVHWQYSVVVASLSLVLARRTARVSADTAMLTGLVHGVGKLYILTHASRYPALFNDPAAYQGVQRDWHANVAKALLEGWIMPEEIVTAVHRYEDESRQLSGTSALLADILDLAVLLCAHKKDEMLEDAVLTKSRAASRLMIDANAGRELLAQSTEELKTLRHLLVR
jgi:HD-like signal output (HDOD) protein